MAKTSGSEHSLAPRRLRAACLALALVTLRHAVAVAEPDDATKNAARELAEQAARAMESGDYGAAQDLYQRAYLLVPAPTLSVRRARALEKQGRWVEALEAYVLTVRSPIEDSSPAPFKEAVEQAREELAALRPRVPRIKLVLHGASRDTRGLRLELDGHALSTALIGVESPVDPGQHRIVAMIPDGRHAERTFDAQPESSMEVALSLPETTEPPVAAEDSPPTEAARRGTEPAVSPRASTRGADRVGQTGPPAQRTWALVALGAGAAGIGLGVVTGLMATSKHRTAEEECPSGNCVEGSSGARAVDSFRSLRTVSTVGYVVGALGVGAGVTLWLTAPEPGSGRVGTFVGPDRVGVRGSF